MAHPARFLAAALLVAALAVPATLHASGLPGPQPAARDEGGISSRLAESWSFDWVVGWVQRAWTKVGPCLDPHGGGCLLPSPPATVEVGPCLDPSGGKCLLSSPRVSIKAGANIDLHGGGR